MTGMGRDITVTLEDGTQHIYQNAPDNVTPEAVTARAQQEFGQPVKALDGGRKPSFGEEVLQKAKVAGSGLVRGLASLPALAAEAGMAEPRAFDRKLGNSRSGEALADVQKIGTQPKTTAERYLSTAMEGVGSAPLSPGMGAVTGLSSELGGQLTANKNDPDGNPLARLLGGLVGGGTVALGKSLAPNAQRLTQTALKGVTPADWANARAMETTLNDLGVPHLKSQLLGPGSSLDDIVRDASANPAVRPSILNATRGVKGKSQQALEVHLNRDLPVQTDERRDFLLGLQGKAAEREADLLKQKNDVFARNLPAGLEKEIYTEAYIQQLRKELSDLSKNASEGFGANTNGGRALAEFVADKLATKGNGMSKMELGNLYNEINAWGADKGLGGRALRQLKDKIGDFTPEFKSARDAASAFFKSDVDPMRQGLAGDIAHARGGPNSTKYTATDAATAVFPLDKAQPIAIKKLAEDVGGEQVGLLLRDHLTRNFERAAKGLGEGEMTPAKWVEAVVGTPAQRQNVEAALIESAKAQGQNPQAVLSGFRKLINAFASYQDLKLSSGISQANLGFEAGKNAAGALIAPQSRAGRWLWERATAKTYQQIADMVTSKDGLSTLEALARQPGHAPAITLARQLVATTPANSGELQPSNTGE